MKGLLGALLLAPGLALAQTTPAPAPLRFVGAVEKVIVPASDTAPAQTLFKASPGKPVRVATTGQMTLVLTARPLVDTAATKPGTPEITILVAGTGAAPVIVKDTITVDAVRIDVAPGVAVASSKVIRIPIPVGSAMVEISAEGGSAVIGFSRTAYTPPVASANEPKIDDSVLAAIPMIRKSVEKFSVGAKAGLVVPAGADVGWGGSRNLYAGAELRFTPPQLERRLSVCLESGIYELHERKAVLGTQPIGSNDGGDVALSTRVVPLFLGASWRFPLGENAGLHAGAGAGATVTRRTESVRFRDDTTTSGTSGAGYLRFAADRKIGRGRALAIEGTWIHTASGDPGFLGGFVTTVHYRVVY